MEWQTPESQRELWGALVRFAQTHWEVLSTIPDQAYVILIPEIDLILDHESLGELLLRAPIATGTPVAYVHLAFLEYYGLPGDRPFPTVTDVRVQVLGSRHTAAFPQLA